MRENKFKVWCKDRNEWEKDYLFMNQEGVLCRVEVSGCVVKCIPENYIAVFYTGLKDKNGVEIYEGDYLDRAVDFSMIKGECDGVVCPKRLIHKCKWVQGSVSFVFPAVNAKYPFNQSIFIGHISEYEVIGNIYENPELLKDV